jgi:hypothetical protein
MNNAILASGCKPWPASGPVVFQPGTCYSFAPHAAAWHITFAGIGWIIAAWLAAGLLLTAVMNWFADQYEVTRTGRFRFRVARRWYGTRAWIARRGHRHETDHHRFQVIRWDGEATGCPWLLVRDIDDEDAEVIWAPVTWFVPEAVRRLRPRILRYGRLWLPVPFAYETLPWPSPGRPSGWPEVDALPGIRGRRLELTRTGAGRWALFRNCASPAHSVAADMDHAAAREWASALLGRDVEWVNATGAPDERCGYWVADPAESGGA